MKKRTRFVKAINLKSILLSIVAITSIVLAITIGDISKIASSKSTPNLGLTIVLDAGHGGVDPGSVGRKTSITESELNLKITLKLKTHLEASGIKCILTRDSENGLYGTYSKDYKKRDMEARKKIIADNTPSAVISIHMNSFTSSRYRGAQVFYSEVNNESSKLAACIQNIFSKELAESNKGTSIGDYYILKCTNSPTVLCECGYLSNAEDEQLLITEEYQNKIAYSIYKGIIYYFNIGNHNV